MQTVLAAFLPVSESYTMNTPQISHLSVNGNARENKFFIFQFISLIRVIRVPFLYALSSRHNVCRIPAHYVTAIKLMTAYFHLNLT